MDETIGKSHFGLDDLSDADRELLTAAAESMKLAYAPYSKFVVGAALITEGGHLVRGANQENASYPLCICGERVALFNKAIQFPDDPVVTLAIRVSTEKGVEKPAPPCGACLQVINEFEFRQEKPIRILLQGDSDVVYEIPTVQKLLPLNFDRSYFKQD